MRNQTTPNEDKYREAKEDISDQISIEGCELKTIKGGIDLFVFVLVLIYLLIDLIVISNEAIIKGSLILSFVNEHISIVFVMLLVSRAKKDLQYNYTYFFLGVLSSLVIEIITSMLLSDYLSGLNLYTETLITGILRAFIWGYFYRSFKIYSMKKLFG